MTRVTIVRIVRVLLLVAGCAAFAVVFVQLILGKSNTPITIGIMIGAISCVYGLLRRIVVSRTSVDRLPLQTGQKADVHTSLPQCRLTITRDMGYADRNRNYTVLIDDRVVGEIAPGSVTTFQVAPGDHKLSVRIDWAGSNPLLLKAEPGCTEWFRVRSALRGIRLALAPWYVLFARRSYLLLERLPS